MKPPRPLILGTIALCLIGVGLMLWQSEGASLWLQQIVSYCL